jgi:hypothetical protein
VFVIPTWISVVGVVATVLSPLLALGGVALGAYLARKSDQELDVWRHREETMRMVRWAVEQILAGDEAGTDAGVVTLRSLMRSELLQAEDYDLVAALPFTAISVSVLMKYVPSEAVKRFSSRFVRSSAAAAGAHTAPASASVAPNVRKVSLVFIVAPTFAHLIRREV